MTRSDFLDAYTDALAAAIARDPAEYGYGAARDVDDPAIARDVAAHIVARMATALDAGTANITGSPAMLAAARRLGIRPTVRDITAAWRLCA